MKKMDACERLELFFSLKLYALEIITLSLTITAPTGTSLSLYAFFASFKATSINLLFIFPPKNTYVIFKITYV